MFLDSRNLLNPAKNVVEVVTVPVQFGVYRVKLGVQDFFSFATFWKSGEARIKDLELRNLELQEFKSKAEVLERENDDLRKQIGASSKGLDTKIKPAAVIGKHQYLEIDGDFKVGSMVTYVGNLVGTVLKSDGRVSFVQLPTDSGSKIPVRVNRATGEVVGQFNTGMLLDRVASTQEVNVGDFVVSTPGNLLIGKVEQIVSVQTDVFVRAKVSPLINFDQLTTVFVLE